MALDYIRTIISPKKSASMIAKSTLSCFLLLFISFSLNAQWVKTNGPEGISVTSFFDTGPVLLCGTNAQGVYKSADHGNTWSVSNQGLQNKWIQCFAKDSLYVYAGSFGEGVFRSSNNGTTWQPVNTGMQFEAVYSLLQAGGYLFAGTVRNGIFRSANHGLTWIHITENIMSEAFIKAMVYDSPRLMVEADNYIFYSNDLGETWDVDQGPTQFYQIYDFFQKGDTLFASGFHIIFRSTDGGVNWSLPYFLPYGHSVVGFCQVGNTVYAATGAGMFSTTDWGLSWVQIPATGLRTGGSDFIMSGNNFVLGREEIGIAVSADLGNSWTQIPLSQFAPASNIDDSMIFAHDTVYTGTHGNGVFATADQGNTWTKIGTTNQFDSLSNESIFSMLSIEPHILLAGGCGTGLFRSANNGATWNFINDGLPPEAGTDFTCINSLVQAGPNILAALTIGVYYSTDSGLTWHPTSLTGPNVLSAGGFAVHGNIVCTTVNAFPNQPGFPSQTGIYRSTDYGITWNLVAEILDVGFLTAGGGQNMYGGFLFSSYVSHDDGFTWLSTGLSATFTVLAWNNYAFVGNNLGVFFSNDSGTTWAQVNQGMDPYPNNAVQGLTTDSVYLYAGMYRDAVWRRPLSDFGIAPPPCSHIVSNTANSGTGSLRDAIACAESGVTITFSPTLADQIIKLTTGEIEIKKDVTISGLGMEHLILSGNNASRVFHLFPGKNLTLKNLALEDGNAVSNGGALFAEGHLILENVQFQNNMMNGLPRAFSSIPPAQVEVMGTVNVKN
ncbi:MAG TPA: hypothetical protein VFG10_14655 [Saprospiraceae bacterium]|nr:hypothetical protein [Saprospiraceae bacterium]